MNVQVEQLQTAFNITWDPPLATPSAPTSYTIHYKLTTDKMAKEITLPATNRHFVLSTWPHYGREYEIEITASFSTFKGAPTRPLIERTSECSFYNAYILNYKRNPSVTSQSNSGKQN